MQKILQKLLISFLLSTLSACGYHFGTSDNASTRETLSIPYIQGDSAGQLTNELTQQVSSTGAFRCVQTGGRYTLKVAVLSDGSERIGFRYDRKGTHNKRREDLVAIENRRLIVAEVTLIDSLTNETVLGPEIVKADAEYDYTNPNSIRDLRFKAGGFSQPTIDFSLGQLDSIEGAQDAASTPLYRHLAQKIVDGIMLNIP
jgi:hypothetical protein